MKKKLLTLLLGVATVAIAMAATNSTLPADTNGDGTINTLDVVEVYVEMSKGFDGSAPDSDDSEF